MRPFSCLLLVWAYSTSNASQDGHLDDSPDSCSVSAMGGSQLGRQGTAALQILAASGEVSRNGKGRRVSGRSAKKFRKWKEQISARMNDVADSVNDVHSRIDALEPEALSHTSHQVPADPEGAVEGTNEPEWAFLEGTRVSQEAVTMCVPGSEGSKADAQQRCNEDPNCVVLLQPDCNADKYLLCDATDDKMRKLKRDPKSDDACTWLKNLPTTIHLAPTSKKNFTWGTQFKDGAWQKILHRKEWQKTFRCRNDAEESCEECEPGIYGSTKRQGYSIDCFGSGLGGSRYVFAENATWTRFLQRIHLRCGHPYLAFHTFINNIRYGAFRLYWDGEELTDQSWLRINQQPDKSLILPFISPRNVGKRYCGSAARCGDVNITGLTSPAAHELTIEFSVGSEARVTEQGLYAKLGGSKWGDLDPGGYPGMMVSGFSLEMTDHFARCEDHKVCLSKLAPYGVGMTPTAGLEMRNENWLQLRCLQTECTGWQDGYCTGLDFDALGEHALESKYHTACTMWRECLDRATLAAEHLAQMMDAAGVTMDDPSASGAIYDAPVQEGDSTQCMYPPHEDPESWDCDCYEEMQARCDAVDIGRPFKRSECIQAQFCSYPKVCHHWKDEHCHKTDVADLIDALTSARSALLQTAEESNEIGESASLTLSTRESAAVALEARSARQHVNAAASGMDTSLGDKSCM